MALSQAMALSDAVSVCLCLCLCLCLSLALSQSVSGSDSVSGSVSVSGFRAPPETMAPSKLTSTLMVVPHSFGHYIAICDDFKLEQLFGLHG